MRKFFRILLIPVICLFFAGSTFAVAGNAAGASGGVGSSATVILDSPGANQSFKPGANVEIAGTVQNISQVAVLVRNAGGGIAYAAQPSVVNGRFSTAFQLNDDAAEGQYSIRIGAEELDAPANFTFEVSKSSGNDDGDKDDKDSPDTGGGGGGGAPAKAPAVTSTTGAAKVTPEGGGTISLGSEAAIEVPAGALQGAETVEIKVEKVTAPPAVPAGFKLAGNVYEFSIGGKKSYDFAGNVTIKLSFDPKEIGENELPAIHYYDEAQGEWINLGGIVSGNTVIVQINHFTKFAVMAEKKDEAPVRPKEPVLIDISGHWAMDNINKLITLDAISGYPDGSFKPDNTITRAEFATVLVKAYRLENQGGRIFDDTATHWAKDYIAAAAANGIVQGYDAATFGPNDLISREQMAVMIVRAAKLDPAAEVPLFADSNSISGWAREAVATATGNKIINGYPDNTVRPQGNATRAEAVTVIVNAMNR